jgi:hypothetical protein
LLNDSILENREIDMAVKKKERWFDGLWPKITDMKSAGEAAKFGAYAAWWEAISITFVGGYMIYYGKEFSTGKPFIIEDSGELIFISVIFAAAIALIIMIGFWVYRCNRVWSILVLLGIIFEVASKTVNNPGRGIVISILVLLLAISGVRGSFAFHNFKKTSISTDANESE